MAKTKKNDLNSYTTLRIKNSTLRRLKYNNFYSESLSDKVDYLITYWEATAEEYHRDDLKKLLYQLEFFNNDEPLPGFGETEKRLKSLFAKKTITYVIAQMTGPSPKGLECQQLYVTFYRKSQDLHRDMRRHPFALMVVSPNDFQLFIPINKDCLTGVWPLKKVEEELVRPEWIEEKLIPSTANGAEVTVSIEESYKRVVPENK